MKNYKVVALKDFTYENIEKVEFTKRGINKGKWIIKGDEFLCDKETFDYLRGGNAKGIVAVDLIEILKKEEQPKVEVKEEVKQKKEIKEITKKTTKKKSKK